MNKPLYFKICTIAIGSFLVIWSAVFTVFLLKERSIARTKTQQQQAQSVQNNTSSVKSAEIDHYIARTTDGKVAVYEVYTNGFTKLISIPDIPLKQLSDTDRSIFDKGIILKSRAELASLIEDFTS